MSSSSKTSEEPMPSWEKLPRDITAAILHKLGLVEILMTAQKVCTTWLSVSRDPSMWRCIDFENSTIYLYPCEFEKLCRRAVDLSRGQLIEINFHQYGTDDMLHYISERCSQLKRLQFAYTNSITGEALMEAVKNLPLLEELHLHFTYINVEVIETIGLSCPLLKSFKLNHVWRKMLCVVDLLARAIAKRMPGLRHLQLLGNELTNEGLQAILEGCPHLESLDLRRCFNLRFDGNLAKLCSERIKYLKRPCDPIEDWECSYEM